MFKQRIAYVNGTHVRKEWFQMQGPTCLRVVNGLCPVDAVIGEQVFHKFLNPCSLALGSDERIGSQFSNTLLGEAPRLSPIGGFCGFAEVLTVEAQLHPHGGRILSPVKAVSLPRLGTLTLFF